VVAQATGARPEPPAGAAETSTAQAGDPARSRNRPKDLARETSPAGMKESFEEQLARMQAEQNAQLAELRSREEAERDLERKRMVQQQIEGHTLAAARRNVSITMYSTAWCGACKAARSYMDREQIAYTEHDVDHDSSARERAHRLNPRGSIPIIDIDGDVLIGFSPKALESKIDASARKRARL
jgi:glutaredoxin